MILHLLLLFIGFNIVASFSLSLRSEGVMQIQYPTNTLHLKTVEHQSWQEDKTKKYQDPLAVNSITDQFQKVKCKNGKYVDQKCQCQNSWIGQTCSIQIIEVSQTTIHPMSSQIQYFSVTNVINDLVVNWQANQVFLINPKNGQQLRQIKRNDRFLESGNGQQNIYKIIGKIGNVVIFKLSNSIIQESQKLLCNIMLLLPLLTGFTVYLMEKFPSSADQNQDKLKVVLKTVMTGQDCSICLTNQQKQKVLLDCGHSFHQCCLKEWLQIHDTCPYCRHRVISRQN